MVNHIVSGLVLISERLIQPGEMVEVETTAGTVREIGLRATTIRTYDGADVVVPTGVPAQREPYPCQFSWRLTCVSKVVAMTDTIGAGALEHRHHPIEFSPTFGQCGRTAVAYDSRLTGRSTGTEPVPSATPQ